MSVMRNETGYRGSRLASRLGDGMHAVRGRVLEGLHRARGPVNDCAVDLRGAPQPEVEPAVVLARESRASVPALQLPAPLPPPPPPPAAEHLGTLGTAQ